MQKLEVLECCNYKSEGRIYYIGDNSYLVCVECPVCGRAIAEIRSKTADGKIKINTRRSGEAAEKLYQKYSSVAYTYNYKVHGGTQAKEYNFINRFGIIYNDNGVKIAEQSKFLNMSRSEIASVLNSRFYKTKLANV